MCLMIAMTVVNSFPLAQVSTRVCGCHMGILMHNVMDFTFVSNGMESIYSILGWDSLGWNYNFNLVFPQKI